MTPGLKQGLTLSRANDRFGSTAAVYATLKKGLRLGVEQTKSGAKRTSPIQSLFLGVKRS